MLSEEFLDEFRKRNPGAKLIMYQWDSNKSNPFQHLLDKFDKVYSFDFDDCKSFTPLNYQPLFYSDDIGMLAKDVLEYDFFFMGWFLQERYDAVIKFREFAIRNGFRVKIYLYMPFSSWLKEYLQGNKLDRNIVSLKKMKRTEYLSTLNKSNVMVDTSSPNQTGLAMRVVEALASGTKVLTNNYRITEDRGYDKNYVSFFDPQKPFVETSFLQRQLTYKVKNILSIEAWLKSIFMKDEEY